MSGSYDKTVKLWQVSTGREIRIFNGHSKGVTAVAFSPDGQLALSGSLDKTVKLWQVSTGREIRTFNGHSNSVWAVAFSPDGQLALSGSADKTVKLWQVSTGREILTFKGHSQPVSAVAFSADGQLALSGSDDKTLKLWQVSTGREIRTFNGHSSYVAAVALSADGQLALSGSLDSSTRLWNVQTGKEIAQMVGFKDGEWATVTAEGYYVASAGGEQYIKVRVGNQVSGVEAYRVKFNRPDLVKAALPAGKTQIAGISNPTGNTQSTQPPPKDTTPPSIIVLYPKERLITKKLTIDSDKLHGQATDSSGIASVTVNGQSVQLDKQGHFYFQLSQQPGENQIKIEATDKFNNTASKTLTLSYQPESPPVTDGNYYALVIGINRYPKLKDPRFDFDLDTAVNDARAVADLLQNRYGFKVKTLLNQQASRTGILRAYRQLAEQTQTDDNLLIYYAGHGHRDTGMDKAYWLPADAERHEDTWIVADRVTGYLKNSPARNILIVADSCYSGGLAKTRNIPDWQTGSDRIRKNFLTKMKQLTSRILISSGGDHPVSDRGGNGHSIFAQAFIDWLRDHSKKTFTAEELLLEVKQRVAGTSEQVPDIYYIRNSGHQGGDFVFEGQ